MSDQPQHQPDAAPDELRTLPSWTRRYAQSRSLELLVRVAIDGAALAVFAALGLLSIGAYRTGSMSAVVACGALAAGFGAWWVWFILGGRYMRLVRAATAHLYRHEGEVTVEPERQSGPSLGVVVAVAAALVGVAVLTGLLLAWGRVPIPVRYIQPITALFVVPFVVVLWACKRSTIRGPIALLWPALYGLHALLIVAGLPILFTKPQLVQLNVLLPAMGYGLLTGLMGHLYNRHALARMRQLAGPAAPDRGGAQP